MAIQIPQQVLEKWTKNLQTAGKTITISMVNGEIVKVTDAVGNDIGSFGGWLQSQLENNWEEIKKDLAESPVANYIAGVANQIGDKSWDALGAGIFQVPFPVVGSILNSFLYAEDALAWLFKIVLSSFKETAELVGADGMANYTKYMIDASQTMFKNRKFDEDDIENIIKTWNSNHPERKISVNKTSTYLGFSVGEMKTVSLAQIIIALFYSLYEGLLIVALAKGLVAAYKKLAGNAKNAYKVGLAKIMRSRVAAFYRIKLTYLKYVDLVAQGEMNPEETYGNNNVQILNWSKRIHDKIDELTKKDIPRTWFDATLWYVTNNNEQYDCMLSETLYKSRRKAKELNKDPESLGKIYVGMQKQIYKMIDSVSREVVDKQIADAETKKEKTSQTSEKDVQ
jgi:hypothetical protein